MANKIINKEDEIRKIAHRIWVENGKPDGELLVPYYDKMVPLKFLHWMEAETEYTYGPDYLKSW